MSPRKPVGSKDEADRQSLAGVAQAMHDVLAHLNFSSGAPDSTFLKNLNVVWSTLPNTPSTKKSKRSEERTSDVDAEIRPLANIRWEDLFTLLESRLAELEQSSALFKESTQVRCALAIGLKLVLPAYREFHRDQLFHLTDTDYENPFFCGRALEAVVAQRGPWDETVLEAARSAASSLGPSSGELLKAETKLGQIVEGAVRQMGDFVGYRCVAVLENGQQMALYDHERVATLPLYIEGAGVAAGPYEAIISRTIEFLKEAPRDLLEEAYVNPDHIAELVLDPRAHDHLHPVYKRTNYMFGEWDPDSTDTKGNYRRLVIRRIVLQTLVEWVNEPGGRTSIAERLFDASAALCGTILMASSVSGSGPDSHDSTISLSKLLPIIAHRRDEFYRRLMSQATGARGKRLQGIEKKTRQPFGHVRQYLNLKLSSYGANQVQHRELAMLEARMGYVDAAREDAAAIPAASIRIETEIQAELSTSLREIRAGQIDSVSQRLLVSEELLRRGIECGALVDPWNILGFQGQFPLFQSREDSIPDSRIETLLAIMEEMFHVYTRVLIESAILGRADLQRSLSRRFQTLAEWWDRFASHVIEDLPEVVGTEAWESANHVADILMLWHQRGHAAGDMSFWKKHIDRFTSAHAYGPVVEALLMHHDDVAAFALLTQWLGQIETVGFEAGNHSLFGQLIHWMRNVVQMFIKTDDEETGRVTSMPGAGSAESDSEYATTEPSKGSQTKAGETKKAIGPVAIEKICRMFDYLEANAGDYWDAPTLAGILSPPQRKQSADWMDAPPPSGDAEDNLFEAAYDDVIFEDSADDGNWGETLDSGSSPFSVGEFEGISRELEPRLKFLNALGQMLQLAAVALAPSESQDATETHGDLADRVALSVANWRKNCRRWEVGLLGLMDSISQHEVTAAIGDHDANIEYDLQLQVKFYLLNQIVMTLISLKNAERLLSGALPDAVPSTDSTRPEETKTGSVEIESLLTTVYRAVARRDATTVEQHLPKLMQLLQLHPMLYIPFEHGGKVDQVLRAQTMQSVARFLLSELPRLGLLKHTWHLANTIFKMERRWRPDGQAITEFDRLFDVALRNVVNALLVSARGWTAGGTVDEDVLEAVSEMMQPFQDLWLKHSRTMRLSSVDGIRLDDDWAQLYEFVQDYGAELFHASQLTLGHLRAVLHRGIEWFIEYLIQEQDPLRPMPLLDDLDAGTLTLDDACWCLENLYSIVVDKFDRFLEYNTTTTQSDYGEMFYCLLDFLRLEARYDRDAWNHVPLVIVHEILARQRYITAAGVWGVMFEAESIDVAERHLRDLSALEKRHGMRMPAIADHLQQRFTKPLKVNEMLALVAPAIEAARETEVDDTVFSRWRALVQDYLKGSWGSGIDVPGWIRQLDREATETLNDDQGGRPGAEVDLSFPIVTISQREFRQQLASWKDQLTSPSPKRPNRPPNTPNGRQDPRNKRHRRGK